MAAESATNELSGSDIAVVQDIMREYASLELDSLPGASTRLALYAKTNSFKNAEALVSALREAPHSRLAREVAEFLINNETSFYRDARFFSTIRNPIIPSAIQRNADSRSLTIWSAASSSGQEIYSIAILIKEHFPELEGWDITLLASDVSGAMVERARGGRFSQLEMNRGLPAYLMIKRFAQDGGTWILNEEIRKSVIFSTINLARKLPPLPKVDLLLLRNVLVYMQPDVRRQIVERVRGVLSPGGVLLLGATEHGMEGTEQMERERLDGYTVYRNQE